MTAFLTAKAAARRLRVTPKRVHDLVKKYGIPWTWQGRKRVMTESHLELLIERQSQNKYRFSEYHRPNRVKGK